MAPVGWTAGKYGITFDGKKAGGHLKSVSGFDATGEVKSEAASFGNVVQKSIGGITYAPGKLTTGVGMSLDLQNWVAELLAFKPTAQSGSILELSHDGMKVMRETQFFDAWLTKFTVPKLSADSTKDPLYLQMEVQASRARKVEGDGKAFTLPQNKVQKAFSSFNFAVTIDGISGAAYHSIDGFSVTHKPVQDHDGMKREYAYVPGPVSFSDDITIEVPAQHAKPFIDWHKAYVIDGSGSDVTKHEKSGAVAVMSNDTKEELFKIEFQGLGIKAITMPELKDGADQKRAMVTCKFYVEQFKMVGGKTAAGG